MRRIDAELDRFAADLEKKHGAEVRRPSRRRRPHYGLRADRVFLLRLAAAFAAGCAAAFFRGSA